MPIPDYQSLMLPVLRVAGREAIHVADCKDKGLLLLVERKAQQPH